MAEAFDAYHRWLGIPPTDRPLNHYRLLGLQLFESDAEVIRDAAERQMGYVRQYQLGQHVETAQRILNELGAAKGCLLDSEKKTLYDAQLRSASAAARRPLLRAVPLEETQPSEPTPSRAPPPLPPAMPTGAKPPIALGRPTRSMLAVAGLVGFGAVVVLGIVLLLSGGKESRDVAAVPAKTSQERAAAPAEAPEPTPPPAPPPAKQAVPTGPAESQPVASQPSMPAPVPAEPVSAAPAPPIANPVSPESKGGTLPGLELQWSTPGPNADAKPATPEPKPDAASNGTREGKSPSAGAAGVVPPLDPNDEVGKLVQDALKLIESGTTPAAYEMLKEALKADRQDIRAEFMLGLMEALAGAKPDAALKRFEHCLDKDPGDPAVLNNYALVSVRLKLYPQAVRYWKKALEAGPVRQEIVQNTGRMEWLVGKAFKLDSRAQEMLMEVVAKAAAGGQAGHDPSIGWLYSSSPLKGKPVPTMESKAYEDVRCPICFGTGRVECPNRSCKQGKVSKRVLGGEFGAPPGTGPRFRSEQTVYVADPRCGGRGWVGCVACEGNAGNPTPDYIRPGSGVQPGLTPPRSFQKTGEMRLSQP